MEPTLGLPHIHWHSHRGPSSRQQLVRQPIHLPERITERVETQHTHGNLLKTVVRERFWASPSRASSPNTQEFTRRTQAARRLLLKKGFYLQATLATHETHMNLGLGVVSPYRCASIGTDRFTVRSRAVYLDQLLSVGSGYADH